ncbi:hypothetical protein WJX73_006984 [Symbiochloris irregularis]|uniref:COX assembly mitochondrial protein n=1 Tax=Symbiochloris irregularis TaxID=706552 RepID=A0AAW1PS19_9CHLO
MSVSERQIPKKVQEALRYRLDQKAMADCKEPAQAYADCCRGKTLSVVWSCRQPLAAFKQCLQSRSNEDVMNELMRRWMEAGMPQSPNWDSLLQNL